jgi:hypothetical protein
MAPLGDTDATRDKTGGWKAKATATKEKVQTATATMEEVPMATAMKRRPWVAMEQNAMTARAKKGRDETAEPYDASS